MKGLSFILKDKNSLYISVILILLLGIGLFSLSYIYDTKDILDNFTVSIPEEQIDIEKDIRSNGDLYTKAPLGKNYIESSSQGYTYSILSYNKSWRIHRVLEVFIQSNRSLYLVFGLIFSNYKFVKNKEDNLRYQMRNLSKVNLIGTVLTIIIGYIVLIKMDGKKISGTELLRYVDNIYLNYNVWKPGFIYNSIAIVFTILVMFSYSLVGFLIGVLISKILVGLLVYIFLSPMLYLYPVSPIYFLRKVRKYAMVPTNMFLYNADSNLINFIFLLLISFFYLIVSYLISIRKK